MAFITNFTDAVSPLEQRNFFRWALFCVIMLIITITALGTATYFQIKTLQRVRNEEQQLALKAQSCQNVLDKKTNLEKMVCSLKKQQSSIQKRITSPKNPLDHLQALIAACSDDITIDTIELQKKQVCLMARASSMSEATQVVERLKASQLFNNIAITTIRQDTKAKEPSYSFTIKGNRILS